MYSRQLRLPAATALTILSWFAQAEATEQSEEVVVTVKKLEENSVSGISQARLATHDDSRRADWRCRQRRFRADLAGVGACTVPHSENGAFDYVTVSLHGLRTEDMLWVRINNRLYVSTTPLDTIPARLVERIETLEGGQGLFHGTQAVAGVVNVVCRERYM